MLQSWILRILKDSEKHAAKQNWLAGSKRRTMDKEEAERLARAIRKAPVDWIQVSEVEQNPTTDTYEVQRSGAIYTWLTQPILDPTSSGRVVMDYLMKLVTTALEWSYQAGETDVRAETLEVAASLLVLRRDTLRLIDGAGPDIEAPR